VKLFAVRKDGGPDSNVTGYWLVECKPLFSIALLKFEKGSREAFHSHAFNAVSWILSGELKEERIIDGQKVLKTFKPSLKPIITTKHNLHRVHGITATTWALSFRGPWDKTWIEMFDDGSTVTLTNGRRIIERAKSQ
jgi:hypothetical protein